LGCLPGASRRANAVWERVFGSLLDERRCFRRLEISRRHQTRTAAVSVALTPPGGTFAARRRHAHALSLIGDGPVLGLSFQLTPGGTGNFLSRSDHGAAA